MHNKQINELICKNEEFWSSKYFRDFGQPEILPEFLWKDLYEDKYYETIIVWRFGFKKDNLIANVPVLVQEFENIDIKSISVGQWHTLILDFEGYVWAFGEMFSLHPRMRRQREMYGQLGLGDIIETDIPKKIPSLNNIIEISSSLFHNLVLDSSDHVWGFGYNEYGQLGLGDEENRNVPTIIQSLIDQNAQIISISTGSLHNLVLDSEGHVWSFGYNASGQLGLGDNINRNIPTKIPNLNDIISISSKGMHSLVLDSEGYVWSFGNNNRGQLGLGDNIDRDIPTIIQSLIDMNIRIVEISAGGNHNFLLDNNGNAWSFGRNDHGQLGLGDNIDRHIPTKIPNIGDVVSIFGIFERSFLLNSEKQVLGFGSNSHGQLGLGDNIDRNIPTQIPNLRNIVLFSIGGRWQNYALEKISIYPFFKMQDMLKNGDFVNFYSSKQSDNTSKSVLTFIDSRGKEYNTIGYYDETTNQILENK